MSKKKEYWNSLSQTEQDWYLSQPGSEGDTPAQYLRNAIDMAWRQSPGEKAKREQEEERYWNEMLTCKRSGKQYRRKDGVNIAGDSFVAFESLSQAEKDFLEVR